MIGSCRSSHFTALRHSSHPTVRPNFVVCCHAVLCCVQIVAGALVEGGDDDESAPSGNAGSWINVELMLEEVRGGGTHGRALGCATCCLRGVLHHISSMYRCVL